EGLGYDVVDYHKGAMAGYVVGKVVNEKTTIALFMLSSGEWAAAIAPAKPPFLFDGLFQFEIIDDQSNSTCFKRVEKLLRGICYEADEWLLYQHSKQVALIHKPTGRKWDFSNSVGGGGEDLGSFIWPVEPEHARTIAATLAFARMWLYPCDFS
ncbi:MAG: hypothetical protein K0Q55_2743, partial [Verrucomicrobia bacterium]|nr:hypothetical protein [Verrucomicrobiota bacterium]